MLKKESSVAKQQCRKCVMRKEPVRFSEMDLRAEYLRSGDCDDSVAASTHDESTRLILRLALVPEPLIAWLHDKYGLDVALTTESISVVDEVAFYRKRRLTINVRSRGVEATTFIIAHVFGHLVQFATTDRYAPMLQYLDSGTPPFVLDAAFKRKYFAYEEEAFQLGRAALEAVFQLDEEIDRRYQIFMLTDFQHYWRYLETGLRGSRQMFESTLKQNIARNDLDIRFPMTMIELPATITFPDINPISVL